MTADHTADALDLDALRKVAEAATPPPWYVVRLPGHEFAADVGTTPDPDVGQAVAAATLADPACLIEDAEHIAAFDPATVLTLLDRLEAAEAKVARVRAVHADAGDGWCLGCDAECPCATWDALRGESS